jgi:hypothetical protein
LKRSGTEFLARPSAATKARFSGTAVVRFDGPFMASSFGVGDVLSEVKVPVPLLSVPVGFSSV